MNQAPKILTVKFPYALAARAAAERHLVNKYETNQFIKNITFFLILKAESPFSFIQNYKKQIDHLAFITQCERQTFNKRLAWLVSEGLATIEGADIRLISWKQVSALYYCNLDSFKLIQYNPNEQKNLHLHLFAVEIEDNKNRQTYMIKNKLAKNPALTQTIKNVLHQHGADGNKLNSFDYLLNAMRILYKNSFVAEPTSYHILNQVRPDLNRGVRTIARAWDCKSPQTVCYWKKKLASAGIIRIYKGEYLQSQCRTRDKNAVVMWNKTALQTILKQVDTLYIIPQPGTSPKPEPGQLKKRAA